MRVTRVTLGGPETPGVPPGRRVRRWLGLGLLVSIGLPSNCQNIGGKIVCTR